MTKRTIAILTGGGDCPGLNAAIRGITKTAIQEYGWDVLGIHDGYDGLIKGHVRNLNFNDVSNILPIGGTILGTSNKASLFDPTDVSGEAIGNLEKWKVDTLFCIGGDGTLSIAGKLHAKWPKVIGLPKTIDNDLRATDQTFGFDTACSFVTEALDRLHSTAQAHHRVMVVEVMGRYAGWIALQGGIAGGGDIILIPELPFSYEKISDVIHDRKKHGKRCSIIVVAEGAHAINESYSVSKVVKDSPDPVRLGGIGFKVADHVEKETGIEARTAVLGHLQRGGSPTFFDRVLATKYGVSAVYHAAENNFGKMMALRNSDIVAVDISEATSGLRTVSLDNQLLKAAKSLGTSFAI